MIILSLSKSTTHIAYAIFDDKTLVEVDTIYFKDYREELKLKAIYDELGNVIVKNKIDIVIAHLIDLNKVMKKDLQKIIEMRAIIQLLCANFGVIYKEFKTNGWEYYITNGRNTMYKKAQVVNKAYDIKLSYDKDNFKKGQQEIADAIILGEAVAHKRLQIGR